MIDLRSDTVTQPTAEMRQAMCSAEVGDDVWGGDPTVNRLEAYTAERFGKQAALFTTSCTQSNLIALLTHCSRGDEAIVGQEAHNYLYEGGGGACLGGIQPQPLPQEPDGTLDLKRVSKLIKPDDYHFARTRLLCLENTTWGKVLPLDYPVEARSLADRHGLAMHLDGARIFNASVASGVDVDTLVKPFDSISVCLSKGLGAPAGSLLLGPREWIVEARRWRKMLGGGMRQSGILAAAGIYAMENHVARLRDDHRTAQLLAEGLGQLGGFSVASVHTNMVFVEPHEQICVEKLADHLKQQGILIMGYTGETMRLVTHLDIGPADIEMFLDKVSEFLRKAPAG